MRIAILADQHGSLPEIPPCDLVILSGDITGGPDYFDGRWRPDLSDLRWHLWLNDEFRRWIGTTPSQVIAVAGNHDTCIVKYGWPYILNLCPLHNLGFTCKLTYFDKYVKIWGAPWVRKWDELAFGLSDADLYRQWNLVPSDIDIVVAHHPPLGFGDGNNLGCKDITDMIKRVKPKLVTCGHIHEGFGEYQLDTTKIVNASHKFVIIDIDI